MKNDAKIVNIECFFLRYKYPSEIKYEYSGGGSGKYGYSDNSCYK